MRNFFDPRYFKPHICRILLKYTRKDGEIVFELYVDEMSKTIEYNTPNYKIFLPGYVLNSPYKFGRINNQHKKLIMRTKLQDEDFERLVASLGGTAKKKIQSTTPKLGDLLK